MNKKAFLPLLILIPLIIVGLIVFYFILKWTIGLILTALIWTISVAFIIIAIFVVYLIIKWAYKKSKGGK